MSEAIIPWPRKGDKAFASGDYSPNQVNLKGLAVPYRDSIIALGFKEAADLVVQALQAGETRIQPDPFFFPVAYLYRHSLELNLKCFLSEGIRLGIILQDDKAKKAMSDHNLHNLWNQTRELIETMWPDEGPEQLNATEHVILEFDNIDKSSQEFRYARNKNGQPHLTNAPDLIDLVYLGKIMDGIFRFLDACSCGF